GDDGRYDRERYVPSWPMRYIDDNETGGLSALFVNDGFAVWDHSDRDDIPWDDPPRDAAAVLTALLRARGVTVAGDPAAGAVDRLARLGVPLDTVSVRDGSGLDRGNRITCRLLAAILDRADARGPIAAGLPVAAQSGTLYKRFLATPVAGHLRAKTGSIGGV